MNCGETNVDTTMNVKKKQHKLECKKQENLDEKRDVNMGQTWVPQWTKNQLQNWTNQKWM